MRTLVALIVWSAALCHAAEVTPRDIHPKVFQLVDGWLSDTSSPVVTEINLDAVRTNRNQFDYASVKSEDGWITFRGGQEVLRFMISDASGGSYTIRYQENGGGSLTTERAIRFVISSREIDIDGVKREVSVLRILSIRPKSED